MYVQHEARQHRMEKTQCMDVVICCFSFSWFDTERLSGRAVIPSLEYALSLCGVRFRDTLCAPRASFSRTYHHNQRVVCLRLCRQGVKHQPKEKLGLEQRSGAKDFRSKGYRVSTCSSPNRHSFPFLTIALYSSYTVASHKHQACQWCLVEDTACPQSSLFLPSKSCALA